MKAVISIVFLLFTVLTFSQDLGKKRIDKINKSIVKIFVENQRMGTGFVVREDGWIATCHHVIYPAFVWDSNKRFLKLNRIYAEFSDGEKVEIELFKPLYSNVKGFDAARAFDSAILRMKTVPKFEYMPMLLGNWSDLREGDEVYVVGFPAKIKHRFISRGTVSTKFVENLRLRDKEYSRDAAWSDFTGNKGNSGGPVIKLGRNHKKDKVIGMVSFILAPNGNEAGRVYTRVQEYEKKARQQKVPINGELQLVLDAIEILAESAAFNSVGVSGVLSIDYIDGLLPLTNLE
ncbi:MAG: serine protease [Bacteroidota bacterium]